MPDATKTIEFEGTTHEFPADANDNDIRKALSSMKADGGGTEKAVPPTKPTYASEITSGLVRGAKNLIMTPLEMMKPRGEEGSKERQGEVNYGPTGRLLLHTGQDVGTGLKNSYDAWRKARQSGEGAAGQTLAAGEQLPVVGGLVQQMEKGGPKTLKESLTKFSPEATGAIAEGMTYAVAPKVAGKVAGSTIRGLSRASDLIGIKTRAGAAFDNVETKIGHHPVDYEPVFKSLDRVHELGEKGYSVPKVVEQFEKWITERKGGKHLDSAPGGGQVDTAASPTMPLTFKDARDFFTSFNEAIDWDKEPGGKGSKMNRAVMTSAEALGKQLEKTADRGAESGRSEE